MSTSDSVSTNVNKDEQKKTEVDTDTPVVKFVGYSEDNPNHKIDPFAQTGTLDTSGTSGGAQDSIRDVSPVFDMARAENLKAAARALDPDDPTPSELVILPQGEVTVTGTVKTAEEGKEDVLREVRKLQENPVEVGGPTKSQQEAAEDTSRESSLDGEGNTVVEDSDTAKTEEKSEAQAKTDAEKAAAEKSEADKKAAEKAEADKKATAARTTANRRGASS